MRFISVVSLALGLSLTVSSQQSSPDIFSVPPADAPELAPRGSYAVGVRTVQLNHFKQIDILQFDKATAKAPLYTRPLTVEVWYPAVIPPGEKEETVYRMPVPGGSLLAGSATISIPDRALRDADPVAIGSFPLVIVSHGYPGSRYFLSYLTSNLASKGYVVAAIDHTDSVFDNLKGFESTLLNRSTDQLFTADALDQLSRQPDSFLKGLLDTNRVAIIGYSMGGYGALISAGAGLGEASGLYKIVPGGYLQKVKESNPAFRALDRSRIKAIVAIAPWGGQPPFQAWDAAGLSQIRAPSLFIAGDQDDVADYARGIRPIFTETANSDRCLLVYENARHNTGGNPAPPDISLPYSVIQSFEDPVWRKDRMTAINQHFITAFLDRNLKGQTAKNEYLHVQPEHSDDGKWPAQPMQPDKGEFSQGRDPSGNLFWKGFQRRNALGLEMSCLAPGQTSASKTGSVVVAK